MSTNETNDTNTALWYVIHTYSGYENKVKDTLEQIVENRGLQDYIQEVSVPVEEQVEIKDGKKKVVQKKLYPGYVLVKMILTDEMWYIVRNTRGVTVSSARTNQYLFRKKNWQLWVC